MRPDNYCPETLSHFNAKLLKVDVENFEIKHTLSIVEVNFGHQTAKMK